MISRIGLHTSETLRGRYDKIRHARRSRWSDGMPIAPNLMIGNDGSSHRSLGGVGGIIAWRRCGGTGELAQAIGQLWQELSAATREGEGEDPRFEPGRWSWS